MLSYREYFGFSVCRLTEKGTVLQCNILYISVRFSAICSEMNEPVVQLLNDNNLK